MSTEAFNPNPTIFAPAKSSRSVPAYAKANSLWLDESEPDYEGEDESNETEQIDQDEIFGESLSFILTQIALRFPMHSFCLHNYGWNTNPICTELIRSISDPEHRNMTLEQLAVVSAPQITFDPRAPSRLSVEFTPTVPHCGMSTFIGEYNLGSLQSKCSRTTTPRPVYPSKTTSESSAAIQDRYSCQTRFTSE